MAQVDILMLTEFLHDILAGFIIAGAAHGHQGHRRIQLGQVHNIIAQTTTGGLIHITGNGYQFTGLGNAVGGVEHIDDHITGDGDTFFVHRKTSFLFAMCIFFQDKF